MTSALMESRTYTADTTYSSGDDSEPGAETSGISRIFIDAARFGEVLAEKCSPSSQTKDLETEEAVKGFADLVGRDLDAPKQAASERFAKISVNSWPVGEDMLDGPITLEPESYEDDDEDDGTLSPVLDDSVRRIVAWAESDAETPSEEHVGIPPASAAAEDTAPEPTEAASLGDSGADDIGLSPERIVNLLIDEFGPLTTPGDDEERLLVESDGAFYQEIAILGMVHLTSHRLAFHASLLSVRPDLLPEMQVLKKGPVTIHRPGLRKKRRLWLELSHDMITSFISSKDEDRIRPLRSILLSTVKAILPEDPKHPKLMRIEVEKSDGLLCGVAEFDTEESAQEWRREVQGALYLHRHRRAVALSGQDDDETNGVRISIPLTNIKRLVSRRLFNMASLLSIELADTSSDSGKVDGDDASITSIPPFSEPGDDENIIEIAVVQHDAMWDKFGQIVDNAKAKEERTREAGLSRTFIDFGTLSFVRQRYDPLRIEDEKEVAIRHALSLQNEPRVWYTRARISRTIASSGYFVVSSNYIGFWSKCFAFSDVKYRLPVSMVKNTRTFPRLVPRAFGMTLELEGNPDLSFDFPSDEVREDAINRILAVTEAENTRIASSTPTSASTFSSTLVASPPSSPRSSADAAITTTELLSPLSRTITRARTRNFSPNTAASLPKVINLPPYTLKYVPSKHFVCLTIGSRGDVQPYISLGLGLQKEGHVVTIVTHEEYKDWVEGWGLRHRTAGGDPGALMKLSVEHKIFSPQFFKESLSNFRTWLDNLLVDAWEQCKDADVLLESPSAMAGVHIAEALGIPYFRTFTMPWTKTAEFPHSFLSPPVESASFNISSYILFDNVFWTATSRQINRWRRNTLGVGSTDMGHMAQSKIPFIYNFSTAVVPKPLDWGDSTIISGYWFLDNPDLEWSPPESLLRWMETARADKKPVVYIGFGSITVPNPPAMTRSIVKAVLKSGVRAIVSKGWSSRLSKSDEPEVELPPECYSVDKIPHDWLFPQIDAALHHGGAGTTGASLRAGIPTLIKPWFGDQFFWASRVQKLGAGLKVSSLRSSELANALTKATTDRIMKERAAAVGQKIRSEDGVQNAIQALYTYLPRAGRDRTALD